MVLCTCIRIFKCSTIWALIKGLRSLLYFNQHTKGGSFWMLLKCFQKSQWIIRKETTGDSKRYKERGKSNAITLACWRYANRCFIYTYIYIYWWEAQALDLYLVFCYYYACSKYTSKFNSRRKQSKGTHEERNNRCPFFPINNNEFHI